jgi:formimidoylglutamate deiminase
MHSLHADHALLPSGWARDVLLAWDDAGILQSVAPGAVASAAPRATGPVLPGMANVHSHAFQRAMAGLAEWRGPTTDDFWTWRERMYALVMRMQPEDVEAVAAHLYVEMLCHGYTTVGEFHYLHHDVGGKPYQDRAELANAIAGAAAASGIALTLMPVMYAHGGFGHRALDAAQKRFRGDPAFIVELLEELTRWHLPSPLMRLGVAPHSVRAVDALMLTELVSAARAIDPTMPVHMHVSEQHGEVAQCVATHGVTPFVWISELVPVDERWCLVHATHLTAEERGRAVASRAVAGLCPTTEANLGDGIFDWPAWHGAGGDWAIGGDSHVAVSPFEELRMLECSQRLQLRLRNVAGNAESPDIAANLWTAAANGGARALGHASGVLAPGRRADLVVLDGTRVDFVSLPPEACLAAAMFGPCGNPVRDVYVGGRVVVQDGRHPDGEAVQEAYREALRRLRATQ